SSTRRWIAASLPPCVCLARSTTSGMSLGGGDSSISSSCLRGLHEGGKLAGQSAEPGQRSERNGPPVRDDVRPKAGGPPSRAELTANVGPGSLAEGAVAVVHGAREPRHDDGSRVEEQHRHERVLQRESADASPIAADVTLVVNHEQAWIVNDVVAGVQDAQAKLDFF